MNKNNKFYNNRFKILFKSTFFIVTLFLLILSIAFIPNIKNGINGVPINASTWNSNLSEIKEFNESESEYISIKKFVITDDAGFVTSVVNPTKGENIVTMKLILC